MPNKLFRLVPKSEHSMASHVEQLIAELVNICQIIFYNRQSNQFPIFSYQRVQNEEEDTWKITIKNVKNIKSAKSYWSKSKNNKIRDIRVVRLNESVWGTDSFDNSDVIPQTHKYQKCELTDTDFELDNTSCKFVKFLEKNCLNKLNSCDFIFNTGNITLLDDGEKNFKGLYVEFKAEMVSGEDVYFTTPMLFYPEVLPGKECHGQECNAGLC